MLLTNSAEGGTNGVAVTTGNSGGASGNAWDLVQVVTSVASYDNAHPAHGGLGVHFSCGGTADECYCMWSTATGGDLYGTLYARAYVYITGNPPANMKVITLQSATIVGATVSINSTGKLFTTDTAGTTLLTAANALPLNQLVRVEFKVVGSTSVGVAELKYWTTPDSSGTPTETLTSTSVNTGTTTLGRVKFGMRGTAIASADQWLDDFGLTDVGYLGPAVAAAISGRTITPGRTWQRRYRHRQQVPSAAATAADIAFTGVTATLVLAAPAGSVSVDVTAPTAALTLAAPAGTVSVGLPGATGSLILAAPAGKVSVTLPGVTGTLVFAAPAGAVSVGLPGVTAAVVFAAPSGSVSVTLPGATATLVFAAPVGSVNTGSNVSIPGVTAAVVFSASSGLVAVSLPGATGAVVFAAPTGAVSVGLPGVTAHAVLAAPAGAVSVSIPGATATIVLTARVGAVAVPFFAAGVTAHLVLAASAGGFDNGAIIVPLAVTGTDRSTTTVTSSDMAAATATGTDRSLSAVTGSDRSSATVTGADRPTATVT